MDPIVGLSPDALWLPMTTPHFVGPTVRRASGVRVEDDLSREYLHATSGLWNVNCGFSVGPIIESICEQARSLPYATLFRYRHEPALRLANELVEMSPEPLSSCFFTCSGGTAVEAAIKAVRQYWSLLGNSSRNVIVAFEGSYHGTTYGALSVTGTDVGQRDYGVDTSLTRFLPWPDQTEEGWGHAEAALEDLIEAEGPRIAAVIFEPIQGTSIRPMPARLTEKLTSIRNRDGTLLIADEVTTGFARTGTMFACEWLGVQPDLMTLSKGINSGYLPLGATLVSREVKAVFDDAECMFASGETQGGNPICCAAASATLRHMREEGLIERSRQAGEALFDALRALERFPRVHQVRGRGLMAGVELRRVDGGAFSVSELWDAVAKVQELGLIVHAMPSGLALLPPLTISQEDIDFIYACLATVLE